MLSENVLRSLENGTGFARALNSINQEYGKDECIELQDGAAPSVCRYNWDVLVRHLSGFGVPVDKDTLDLVISGGTCSCSCLVIVAYGRDKQCSRVAGAAALQIRTFWSSC